MAQIPDVTVIGGGVAGCSVAWQLARRGASVEVLEAEEPGSGASGAAAGLLGPLAESVPEGFMTAFALDAFYEIEAQAAELQAESGVDFAYSRDGLLRVALTEAGVAKWQDFTERRNGLGLELHWLTTDEALRLQPRLNPNVHATLYSPWECHVVPSLYTCALAEAARRRGANIRAGVRVHSIKREGGRITALVTSEGRQPVGSVVIAAGAEAAKLGEALGVPMPVRPVRGQMVALRADAPFSGTAIYSEDAVLTPKPQSEVWIGATYEEAGFERRVTAGGLAWLLAQAAAIAPELTDAAFLRAWAGLRPATPDGLPILGVLPEVENGYAALGFFRNGILLSLLAGRVIANLILDATPGRDIAPLSPARFGVGAGE
jgi:glycine oxidase